MNCLNSSTHPDHRPPHQVLGTGPTFSLGLDKIGFIGILNGLILN